MCVCVLGAAELLLPLMQLGNKCGVAEKRVGRVLVRPVLVVPDTRESGRREKRIYMQPHSVSLRPAAMNEGRQSFFHKCRKLCVGSDQLSEPMKVCLSLFQFKCDNKHISRQL
jgi:hypothetical protein